MLRKVFVLASLAALIGCQKGDPALAEKLDRIETKIEGIQRKLDGMGGVAQRPQPPPRRGPDPAAVYSVPIGDAPVRGPATAKVTIVEAAEFA
jgi:protein-disulfide isomerase